MGHFETQIHDPEDLDLAYDDFEEIESEYETYNEYEAYIPDMIGDLKPLTQETLDACAHARASIQNTMDGLVVSPAAEAVARLLLYDEAVSTSQAENYPVTCESMLEANAIKSIPQMRVGAPEQIAMNAVEALKHLVDSPSDTISLDDICQTNALFMCDTDKADRCGTIREKPVWIGKSLFDAIYVAPPADMLDDYVDDIVSFINDKSGRIDPIAKAAIAHAQFITVHPFEDGNGRTGRALWQRVLKQEGVLKNSVLPVTAVAVAQDASYVDQIQDFRSLRGPADPNKFVQFFAQCCESASRQTQVTTTKVEALLDRWYGQMAPHDKDARDAAMAFATCPVMTRTMLASEVGRDVSSSLDTLLDLDILQKNMTKVGGAEIYVATDILAELTTAQRMRSMPVQIGTGYAAKQRRVRAIQDELASRTPIDADIKAASDTDITLPY